MGLVGSEGSYWLCSTRMEGLKNRVSERQLTGLVDIQLTSSVMDLPIFGGLPKSFVGCFLKNILPTFHPFQHIALKAKT